MYLCVSVELPVFFSLAMLLLLPLFVVNLYSARTMSQLRNALYKCYLLSLLDITVIQYSTNQKILLSVSQGGGTQTTKKSKFHSTLIVTSDCGSSDLQLTRTSNCSKDQETSYCHLYWCHMRKKIQDKHKQNKMALLARLDKSHDNMAGEKVQGIGKF